MKRETGIFSKSPTVHLARRIYNSVKYNFATKLIFFMIGTALWLNINLQKDFETTVDIPIKLSNIVRGKTLLEPIPEFARIKIRSKGRNILISDFREDVYFEIDGSTFDDSATVHLNMDYFVNASGLELEPLFIFHPQEIGIVYDDFMSVKVPVSLNYQFTTAPGYVISGDFKFFPDSVNISGPRSKVKKIRSVETRKVADKDISSTFAKHIQLIRTDSVSVKYSAREVLVSQEVVRKGSNTFKAPVRIINKPENMNILLEPIAIDITVVGPVSELQKITAENFSVTADAREIDNITNRIPIKVLSNIKLDWKQSASEVRAIQY